MNYNNLKHLRVDYLKLQARSGSRIILCIMEGTSLAFTENIPVCILHNDKEYLIHPQDIINQILAEGLEDE